MEVSGKRLLLAAVLICTALYHNLAITRIVLLCMFMGQISLNQSSLLYLTPEAKMLDSDWSSGR